MILILNWLIFIMTFGMISIAETTTDIITLDTPIEELNNLTLNEVFRDGIINSNPYFNSGTTGYNGVSSTLSIQDGLLKITSTATNDYGFRFDSNLTSFTAGDKIYYITDAIVQSNFTNSRLRTAFGTGSITPVDVTDNSQPFSYIKNVITSGIPNHFLQFFQSSYFVGDITFVKYLLVINLTSLGINNLTKTQLDDYYDIYINGGYYEYDAIVNDLDMTDFIIISSSFVLWLWFMRFVKGVL